MTCPPHPSEHVKKTIRAGPHQGTIGYCKVCDTEFEIAKLTPQGYVEWGPDIKSIF